MKTDQGQHGDVPAMWNLLQVHSLGSWAGKKPRIKSFLEMRSTVLETDSENFKTEQLNSVSPSVVYKLSLFPEEFTLSSK